MTFDPQKILNWKFPEIEHAYTDKDTILYALGVGCGSDPGAPDEIKYVYERGLVALPTQAVVLAYPGNWLESPESTADYSKVLHGEQHLTLHRPIPPAGKVIGRTRVTDLLDKGKEKGAVLFVERQILDKASGALIATTSSTVMLRGNGGFGGKAGPQPQPHTLPETAPTRHLDIKTAPNSALIYRLSGDKNPLHADPKAAAAGGFKMPILHGLCTYGVAGRALIKACCGGDPTRLKGLHVRFSSPVYPGETIRTEMWAQGDRVSFRARVVERDVVVLNNGLAEIGG
ncbi:MAG: 3-alpha,7-alpha,12-alpha-trihydroxy-5-beta-cholest-24-enoyl-CoA hydratase [Hyphomicrobiaceae bacterium]|nr:MAG: 3-alpha,7-alpha,12-alpha-trihydroxy-5-beta-cholest-24-enoyl-CoA hydratase [Hyphomicrobiaceae bacterium]